MQVQLLENALLYLSGLDPKIPSECLHEGTVKDISCFGQSDLQLHPKQLPKALGGWLASKLEALSQFVTLCI